jgi:hypothetical protein
LYRTTHIIVLVITAIGILIAAIPALITTIILGFVRKLIARNKLVRIIIIKGFRLRLPVQSPGSGQSLRPKRL